MRKHIVQISGKNSIQWLRTKTFTTRYANRNIQLKVAKRAKRFEVDVQIPLAYPSAKPLLAIRSIPKLANNTIPF